MNKDNIPLFLIMVTGILFTTLIDLYMTEWEHEQICSGVFNIPEGKNINNYFEQSGIDWEYKDGKCCIRKIDVENNSLKDEEFCLEVENEKY